MNSKILLLSVAVIAVGLFAMPQTLSLFAGQHTWVTGENLSCQKCHMDIYDEITSSGNQAHNSGSMLDCERCHRTSTSTKTGANITYGQWMAYSSNNFINATNITAHAAVTVECLACHGTGNTTVNGTKSISGVAKEIQAAAEAHRIFYYQSVSDVEVGDINQAALQTLFPSNMDNISGASWYTTANQTVVKLKGTNTACVGCHTHAIVNITWTRSLGYSMNVTSVSGAMNITSWGVNASTRTNYTSGE